MPSACVQQSSSSWPASFLRTQGTEYDAELICRSVRQRILPVLCSTATMKHSLGCRGSVPLLSSCEQLTTTRSPYRIGELPKPCWLTQGPRLTVHFSLPARSSAISRVKSGSDQAT